MIPELMSVYCESFMSISCRPSHFMATFLTNKCGHRRGYKHNETLYKMQANVNNISRAMWPGPGQTLWSSGKISVHFDINVLVAIFTARRLCTARTVLSWSVCPTHAGICIETAKHVKLFSPPG